MILQNNLQRNIGIIASIVVIFGVAGTIIYQENFNSSAAPIIRSNQQPVSTDNTNNTNHASVPVVNATKTTTTYVLKCTGDDDDQNCVKVPVTTSVPTTPKVVTTLPPATLPKNYNSVYKDGTYSATGNYDSPGGQDQISVTLTLKNDIVTDVSVTSGANDRRSQSYQNIFIANYKQYVVGKNISGLDLGKISSSSLTPIGFNDALNQIRTQAKV